MRQTFPSLVAIAGVVLVGCSSGSGAPEPTATDGPVSWQPCDEISPEALAAAGLRFDGDDGSRLARADPQSFGCIFSSDPPWTAPNVTVSGWSMTVDEAVKGEVLAESELGGRRMIATDDTNSRSCVVVIELPPGVITLQVGWTPNPSESIKDAASAVEACEYATGYAEGLAPAFPDRLG